MTNESEGEDLSLYDREIAEAAVQALTLCADTLEGLLPPSNSALEEILEEIWLQIDTARMLLQGAPQEKDSSHE